MVKICPNCAAVITTIGEGNSVCCWYCDQISILENDELKGKILEKELDLPDYDKVYQEESRRK